MPFLPVAEGELFYEVHGSGPPLVFAHGLGGGFLSWFHQLPHFRSRFTCVVFSHRGFSPSRDHGGKGPRAFVDDFGVSPTMINTVFEGAGLFGSTEDLADGRFRRADPAWLADNYFHAPGPDDWTVALDDLLALRAAGPLPKRAARVSSLRAAWDRKQAFGPADRTLGGRIALVVGIPARTLLRAARRMRDRLSGRRPATG